MENLKEIFLKFCLTFNVKESDFTKTSFSGSLGRYSLEKNLSNAYKYINRGDEKTFLYAFKDIVDDLNFTLDFNKASKEQIDNMFVRKELCDSFLKMYEESIKNDLDPLLELVNKHTFFEDEDLDREKVPNSIILEASEWYDKEYLKKYILKKGESYIPENLEKFQISNELFISDNINYFLENFNKEYNDDIVRITTFFKIEKVVDYSYFMFIVNYKDHVIAYSDLLLFDNPKIVVSSRNPRRKVERKQDDSGLPYVIIDHIEKIRENNTSIATLDNKAELYKKSWKQYSQYSRVFTLLLAQRITADLSKKEGVKLVSSESFIERKLIGNNVIDVDMFNDTTFENFDEPNIKRAKEILNNIEDYESNDTSLVKINYDIVKESKFYDETFLAPESYHESHAKWHATNKQVDMYKDKVGKRLYMMGSHDFKNEKRYKTGLKELSDMFKAKGTEHFLKKIAIAKKTIKMEVDDEIFFGFSNDTSKKEYSNIRIIDERDLREGHFYIGNIHLGAKYGWSSYDADDSCPILPKYKGSSSFMIIIQHYKDLMYLLDCEQNELPHYFRIFKHNKFLPYTGNSILNNVHPLNSLKDPASDQFSNGLNIRVNVSRRGYNLVMKQFGGKNRPEEIYIDSTGKVILKDS